MAYGYKNVYQVGNFGLSAACEINVVCPLGNGWENERNSVALGISGNGTGLFSGSLIMNTCATNRPYFLTANHVYEQAPPVRDVTGWRFTFQAWSSTCPNPGINSDGVTYNGSAYRANWAGSDFCLVELNTTPPANSGINYAGWNRNTAGITQTTIIHHPMGDVMKITRDNDAPVAVVHPDINNLNCWRLIVENGNGATEGGSSGSPYFDQNHRIIAQHYGISDDQLSLPVCNQFTKYGGRFNVSWTGGGTNSTRLSNWLDPTGTGAMTTNTTNVASLINTDISISGPIIFCTSATYSVNTTLPVTWSATPSGIVNLPPNGNQVTVSKSASGYVTLKATISSACVPNPKIASFGKICVGTPSPYVGGTFNDGGIGANQSLGNTYNQVYNRTVYVSLFGASNEFTWDLNSYSGNTTWYHPAGYDGMIINFGNPLPVYYGDYVGFSLTRTNQCGIATEPLFFSYAGATQYYIVAPNPVKSTFTITQIEQKSKELTSGKKQHDISLRKMQIVDKMGNIVREKVYPNATKSAIVNTANLKSDVYTVRLYTKDNVESHRIIIQH